MNNGIAYDFIEIGTCDFDTLLEKSDNTSVGLSIEPLAHYLNKLPTRTNVKKINAAVSDVDGFINIYYIPETIIKERQLPEWVRGCNSVGKPHPYLCSYFGQALYDELVTIDVVKTISWNTLINVHNIDKIKCLKIDTEGHESIILGHYFQICKKNPKLLADTIIVECNYNSDKEVLNGVLSQFDDIYISQVVGDDVILNKHKSLYI